MNRSRLMRVLDGATYLISSKPGPRRRMLESRSSVLWGVLLGEDDLRVSNLHLVNCHVIKVGVDLAVAERVRGDLIDLLDRYPDQGLKDGPTYKQVASIVGDDATALRLFGLGQALDIWSVLTPVDFGLPPALADEAAELGMVVISGYPGSVIGDLIQAVG